MKSMKVTEMREMSKEMYDLTKASFALVLLKDILNNPYNEHMTGALAEVIRNVDDIKDRLQRKLDAYLENRKRKEQNDSSEASSKVDNQEDKVANTSATGGKVDDDTENLHTRTIINRAMLDTQQKDGTNG